MRRPCNNCPWRRDAPPAYWHPEEFEKIWKDCQDDGMHTMLCHKAGAIVRIRHQGAAPTPAPPVTPFLPICQGWVRVTGFDAIGVRLAVMQGRVTAAEVHDVGPSSSCPPLYNTFEEMMHAQGITLPPRNRYTPRELGLRYPEREPESESVAEAAAADPVLDPAAPLGSELRRSAKPRARPRAADVLDRDRVVPVRPERGGGGRGRGR